MRWHTAIPGVALTATRSARISLCPADNAHGLGLRIEYDAGVAALELADDVRHFVLERKFLLPVIRSLAQHVRLDDGMQQIRRQIGVRHHYRLWNVPLHSSARPACEPGIEMPREGIAIRLR